MKNYYDEYINGHMTPEEAYITIEEKLNTDAITFELSNHDKKELEKQEHSLEIVLVSRYLSEHGYKFHRDENNEEDFGHWIKED